MLVLTRRNRQRIMIADGDRQIIVTLVTSEAGKARIGIQAPEHVKIMREELLLQPRDPAPEVVAG